MDSYDELAQYVSFWATCPRCDELQPADDFIITTGGAICGECVDTGCPHGLAHRADCALCARGIPGTVSEHVARHLEARERDLRTLGDIADFLKSHFPSAN